ncbi:hypothetical protein [Hymenobacter psoromatis]|uniref:hypothetical protein n=1 Tax=Hymenobacter psoromatis TaxID=1484116 RepID=UPI001CBC335C|nr:hypothetical protein [Hymenobacter psoromatis]
MNPVDSQAYNIFAQAETFMLTAEQVHTKAGPGKNIMLIFPGLASQGFAIELYMKCLLSLEGKPIPKSHNLLSIYDKLCQVYQNKIYINYNHILSKTPNLDKLELILKDGGNQNPSFDFRIILNQVKDVFPAVRYMFEQSTIPTGLYALVGLIMNASRMLILELRPTWFTGFAVMPTNYLYKGITTSEAKERSITDNPFGKYSKELARYYLGYQCINCFNWVNFKIDMVKRPGKFVTPKPIRDNPIVALPIDLIYHCSACYMRSDVSSIPILIEAHTGRKPDLSSDPSWLTLLIGQ